MSSSHTSTAHKHAGVTSLPYLPLSATECSPLHLKAVFKMIFLCSGKNTHGHKPHHVPFNQASESQQINFCFPSATAMTLRHWWTREAHTLAPKCTSSAEEHMLPWLVGAPNQQNKLAISSGISVPLQSFGAV